LSRELAVGPIPEHSICRVADLVRPSPIPARCDTARRLALSALCAELRDVEDLLAARGLDISYETVRRWVMKFGPLFACNLRRQRPRPTERWHLGDLIGRAARRTARRLSIAPGSV